MMANYLVVGAGLTGATFARVKAEAGHKVRVIDRRTHIAGNAYDRPIYNGLGNVIYLHEYGPHIFHTNSKKIYDFLSDFTEWTPYEHKVVAQVNGLTVPLPFNFKSIDILFEKGHADVIKTLLTEEFGVGARVVLKSLKSSKHENIRALHKFIYLNIFKNYTEKMWGMSLDELGPTVADRVPVQVGYDERYFSDTYQALPKLGYSKLVNTMLEHQNISVSVSTDFRHELGLEDQKVFYTGSIDEYYGYSFGHLPYRSLSFSTESFLDYQQVFNPGSSDEPYNYSLGRVPYKKASTSDSLDYQIHKEDHVTVNYPSHPTITRSTSMRGLTSPSSSNQDIIVVETPGAYELGKNEPYYPMPTGEAKDVYEQYASLNNDPNLMFAGRLGSYQYLNLDQAVAMALKRAQEF